MVLIAVPFRKGLLSVSPQHSSDNKPRNYKTLLFDHNFDFSF